jgi:uncharacterized protein (DUF2062 family)
MVRLSASPHAIAAGFAAGITVSWTPFIGLHFLLSFAVAYLVAGNMIAAALGTAFGNPLTFPFIWAATWEVGHQILGGGEVRSGKIDLEGLFSTMGAARLWEPVLKPMLVGAVPLAVVSGVIIYAATYRMVASFQRSRRERLVLRHQAQQAAAFEELSV